MKNSFTVQPLFSPVAALVLLAVTVSIGAQPSAPETSLFNFRENPSLTNLTTQDASASIFQTPAGSVLRVITGQNQKWPGITLRSSAGPWNLAPHAYLLVSATNPGSNSFRLHGRIDNPGADGHKNCVTASVEISPGKSALLKIPLQRESSDKLGGKLFGMRGYPVSPGGPNSVNPSNITQILLFVSEPKEDHLFHIEQIRATGSYISPTAHIADANPFFPFIDTFGQYKHRNWPGKVQSIADLVARVDSEAQELSAKSSPADWNKFGGWATGPQLALTGFFRTEKHRGKWWLVDPEGRLFWSHGVDCVRSVEATPIEDRIHWFEDFPGEKPEFRQFFSSPYTLKGHYAGKSPKSFSFAGANLLRKYGPDWQSAYPEVIHRRLRSWGLNTIANWSDEATRLMRRTPYTDSIGSRGGKIIEGSEGYWGKFADVFDPSFAESVRRSISSKKGKSAGDPWCIGYFSDNELSWGDDVSLAIATLKSPPNQAAKKAFIADLKSKYGEIAKLNSAWGTSHASWDALLEICEAPDAKKARPDLTAFYSKIAEEYLRVIRDAIKEVAPNQLYLGCRFAWANDLAAIAAGKYCDVVSYNLYRREVADFKFAGGDKPLIIGEFHFGALDRGMFHTGLVPVSDQQTRAETYRDYVLGAARHPQFVGTHWFQWMDQPTTGRVYDEENYQIGFVDHADTPYPEMIAATRSVAAQLYQLRLKE